MTATADAGAAAPPVFNEKLASQIETIVNKKIANDSLDLPTMPTVAVKVLDLLKKPDFHFKSIAMVLEQDPLLTAQVLRTANSPAFGGISKVPTLVEALTRLGAKTVKTVIVEAAAEKIFISRNAQINEATRKLWQHSVAVAILARDISAIIGNKDSDAAYLAGLLHDVGKPLVATVLLEAERQIAELRNKPWIETAEWVWVVKKIHRPLGVALTEKWQLPQVISKCIKECSEFDPSDRSAISNAVCFANALAKTQNIAVDDSDIEDAKALVMIGRSMLGVDDAMINPLIATLKQKVNALYE